MLHPVFAQFRRQVEITLHLLLLEARRECRVQVVPLELPLDLVVVGEVLLHRPRQFAAPVVEASHSPFFIHVKAITT